MQALSKMSEHIGFNVCPAGNEVHISTHLDTEYEKKDSNNHFGFKLQVIGYEWSTEYKEVRFLCVT